MKTVFFVIALLFVSNIDAQDNNDILIGVSVPYDLGSGKDVIPDGARRLLINRLYQVVTANGVSGNLYSPRFFLEPIVVIADKEVLTTAPPTIVLSLDITLVVVDYKKERRADNQQEKGNLFQTKHIELKGVGKNVHKAYVNAFRNLKSHQKKIIAFLDNVKLEIIDYYEQNCEIIKKKVGALTAQRKTKDAVRVIANIPLSSDCYAKNEKTIRRLYQDYLEEDCDSLLNQARATWYTSQDTIGARKAGDILKQIAPRAYCKKEILKLYSTISKRVQEITGNDWKLDLKLLDVYSQNDKLNFMREIALKTLNDKDESVKAVIIKD